MSHWATQYIGLPWEFGAAGPDKFDCWGFVRMAEKVHFGIDMPHVGYAADWHETANHLKVHPERANWNLVTTPSEGDVVMMARNRLPIHIGVWINANNTSGVLHCLEGSGVLFHAAKNLRMNGWGSLQYFRHKSCMKS